MEVVNCEIHGIPRIGGNAGSLEKNTKIWEPCPEALVESALANVEILQNLILITLNLVLKVRCIYDDESYMPIAKEISQLLI